MTSREPHYIVAVTTGTNLRNRDTYSLHQGHAEALAAYRKAEASDKTYCAALAVIVDGTEWWAWGKPKLYTQADMLGIGELTAMLSEGMTDHCRSNEWPHDTDGHVGVVQRIAIIAAAIWEWEQTKDGPFALARDDEGFPGVYLYEMVEPFGAFIADHYTMTDAELMHEYEAAFIDWIGSNWRGE